MTEMLFTTSVQPVCWHLGQGIGSRRSVLGTQNDLSYALSESDAVQIEQNSQVRCEKSPGTCPFFMPAPECRPSYEVGGFSASPDAKTGVPMSLFVSAAVRYPQFRSSPDGVARVASLRLLEERIISGTRELRANRFVKLKPMHSSSPGVGLKNCGSQHVLRPVVDASAKGRICARSRGSRFGAGGMKRTDTSLMVAEKGSDRIGRSCGVLSQRGPSPDRRLRFVPVRKLQPRRQMRVLLVHNPKSGDDNHGGDQLIELITRAGHEVTCHKAKRSWQSALDSEPDLVVADGGDGTVSEVARAIGGRNMLVTALPLGTANTVPPGRRVVARWKRHNASACPSRDAACGCQVPRTAPMTATTVHAASRVGITL